MKEMKETRNSKIESEEATLEAIDMTFKKLPLEYNRFIDNSFRATTQILYDMGFLKFW